MGNKAPNGLHWGILASIFCVLLLLHSPLLSLPYFWDEAGHYVPAARDFLLTGDVIPTHTISNAHPPLPMFYLAMAWKLFGYSVVVTRVAMLLVASFAVWNVYLLGLRLAHRAVAAASAGLYAIYPVFFAQSTLAQADMFATALSLWGIRLYFERRRRLCVVAFALAVLGKETAILVPFALFAFELGERALRRSEAASWRESLMLLPPAVPLAVWYAYHLHRTGFIFGNPEFFAYNVAGTREPLRLLLVFMLRWWQVLGYMNLWLLTGVAGAAMLLDPQPGRDRIPVRHQSAMASVIVASCLLHTIVGGAVLARYMMPVIPLVIIIAVSTLWRRLQAWKWAVAATALLFVISWFAIPPYHFAPEDNLNYADFVRLHQQAAREVESRYAQGRVLTAWPATRELDTPSVGYVSKPIEIASIEDFSVSQIQVAAQSSDYDAVLAFSVRPEPRRVLLPWFARIGRRYFEHERDMAPEMIAQMLGGKVVWQGRKRGQWAAVIDVPRARVAENRGNMTD